MIQHWTFLQRLGFVSRGEQRVKRDLFFKHVHQLIANVVCMLWYRAHQKQVQLKIPQHCFLVNVQPDKLTFFVFFVFLRILLMTYLC